MVNSELKIRGGDLSLEQLRTLDNVDVTIDAFDAEFPVLHRFGDSSLTLTNGGTAEMDGVTDIDGSSFFVHDGVTLSLPAATHYDARSTGNSQTRVFRADGQGAVLDLGNLTYIVNGTHYNSRTLVQAINGGEIDLSQVVEIRDKPEGDGRVRAVDVVADGTGSLVRLDALVNMVDHWGTSGGTSHNARWSTLNAINGGSITAPSLKNSPGYRCQYRQPVSVGKCRTGQFR